MKQHTIVDRAPTARCYRCGSIKVYSLCHHCGRSMCKEHSSAAFAQSGSGTSSSDPASTATAMARSKELSWLKQSSPRRMAVHHCAEHNHKVGWFGALMQGRRAARDPASQPPLPLFPHINSVEVVERLAGDVRFDGGNYDSTPQLPVTGEITIEMSASDSAKMLALYRNKFRKNKYRLPADLPISLAAGFALIRGKAGLRFAAGQDTALPGGMGLSFSARSIAGHPMFENVPGRPPGEWRLSVGYEVSPERAPKEIPLWIVPSVTPSSDRRTLEIDLHWNQIDADGRKLSLTQFDLIELVVPAADWGAVQSASVEPSRPNRPTIATGGGRRTIRWERVKPGNDKSSTLQLRFERKILPGPDDDDSAERPDPTFS